MPEYLFSDFRRSRARYEKAVAFWNERVWQAISEYSRREWITPWFSRQHPALEDGNPIFSAWSRAERRGVQIIQVSATEGTDDVEWWIDWFGGNAFDPDAVRNLVIVCAPTTTNRERIVRLMEDWIRRGQLTERAETIDTTAVLHGAFDREASIAVGLSERLA
jgi:hypothetical protein